VQKMKHKTKRFYVGGIALAAPEEGAGLQKETRDEAFARARRNKEKTFEYDGKTFTTEYKEEKAAREAKEKAKEDAEEHRMSGIGDKYRADKAKQLSSVPKAEPRPEPKAGPTAQERSEARMDRLADKTLAAAKSEGLINLIPAGAAFKMARTAGENLAARMSTKPASTVAERVEPYFGSRMEKLTRRAAPKEASKRAEPTYKRGGKVSSASSRGDGIAQRGKTKGRMV
jgi:translation initiation factor IF-2